MSKYDLDFKKKVIEFYLKNGYGYKLTGKHFGLCKSTVRKWIRNYLENGKYGLMSNETTTYDGNYKLNVLEYMYKNHLSAEKTANIFNLAGADRILKWEQIYNDEGLKGLENHSRGRPKSMNKKENQISNDNNTTKDLEKEIEILRAENAYLKKLNALVQERIKRENKKK